MAVKIRLSRIGGKNDPHYRIIVKNAKSRRDGRSLEILGFYDPITKDLKTKKERLDYWLSVGAKPTPTIERLLKLKPAPKISPKSAEKKSKSKVETAEKPEKDSKEN